MTRIFGILLFLLFFTNHRIPQGKEDTSSLATTICVKQPTGNGSIDRNLILSALKKAREGDTIQFAAGEYLVGRKIQIDINGITLKGYPDKTTIRGCTPGNFTEHPYGIFNCGGFELIAQGITVKDFIFEYAWHGIMIGCCLPEDMEQLESGANIKREQFGGHLIINNLFRYNSTGVRVIGINPNTILIRDNVFQDNYHGLTINGSNVKIQGNSFLTLNMDMIPVDRTIDNAIGILPFSTMFPPDNQPELKDDCKKIEIIENTIENITNDIRISDSSLCNTVIIKDNIIKE